MKNFFQIFRTRTFVISFLASLFVVAVVFFILVLTSQERGETMREFVFGENQIPGRTLWIPSPSDVQEEEEEEEEEDEFPYPTQTSILTGLRMYEGYAIRRPLAVVTNNIRQALPQSGIASADIIYEVLAEGDVTRLVAIYQSYIPEKIGSIRSTRDYFIDFAWNHDAIFIFHGGSPNGYARLRSTGITNMDGGRLEGQVFWRDRTYPEWAANSGTRSTEHSSYTGRERIEAHLEANEIRDYFIPDPSFGFLFGQVPAEIEKLGAAHRVTVPFSQNYTRIFIFDEEENIFWVENPTGPHQDAETQEQVSVTNVLIQFAQMSLIAGDYAGRRNVNTLGEGRGYLIAGGEYFPVLWQKSSHTSPTRWTFENGTPLTLSPGKTWICVFQSNGTVAFE